MSPTPIQPEHQLPNRRVPYRPQPLAVRDQIPNYRLWALISIPFGLVFGAIALMISLDVDILKVCVAHDEAWIKSHRIKMLCITGNVLTVLAFPAFYVFVVFAVES